MLWRRPVAEAALLALADVGCRQWSRSEVQLREVEAFVEKAPKRLVAHDVERVRLGARVRFQQHFRCTWERKCRTLSNW